jgi:hypothetical protein
MRVFHRLAGEAREVEFLLRMTEAVRVEGNRAVLSQRPIRIA